MKLYLAAGQYAGTQADAKKITPTYRQVEVPTDKEGLIGYLNKVTLAPSMVAPTYTAPSSAIRIDPKPDTFQRDIAIEEAIAAADYPRAIRLAEHIHCRLMELARAAKPSSLLD